MIISVFMLSKNTQSASESGLFSLRPPISLYGNTILTSVRLGLHLRIEHDNFCVNTRRKGKDSPRPLYTRTIVLLLLLLLLLPNTVSSSSARRNDNPVSLFLLAGHGELCARSLGVQEGTLQGMGVSFRIAATYILQSIATVCLPPL